MFALCYGLYSCSPHWYDHLCFREAQGTFTTELAHVRSPPHESVITTWVNRQLPGRDFHPLETQPYGLHTSKLTGGNGAQRNYRPSAGHGSAIRSTKQALYLVYRTS